MTVRPDATDGSPILRLLSLVALPREVEALFECAFDFQSEPGGAPKKRPGWAADAIICSPGPFRFDNAALSRLDPSVRALATYSVGHEHIDLPACKAAGVAVFNTPDVLADSVADAALLLILGAARRVTESVTLIRGGAWPGWTPTQLNGTELRGKTLGILGMGAIGQRVADRARSFGMSVIYMNRGRLPASLERGARFVADVHGLAMHSDFLLLACPSTAETRHIINEAFLDLARPTMILVNVGRGDLVDDDALLSALTGCKIAGAALDVFDGEPHFDRRYLEMPGVFMLPHIGSSTIEARIAMGRSLVEALRCWAAGGSPPNRLV
ncbi:glyoxylate reductase [Sphingopyxis panaciterrae]|uniref:NAD(P)-dependent oxidoreductase n=1 Tax=Sphingopyxis panaciterrae TaxID=363841 RepID=UPI001420F0FA|nr:NAD(P)-dependent oxidoreductase [Sphingopyxis panaciterrae]NIJ37420.1 glyoxylate reductase [Sphingopyxis panaciterrae]